MAAPEAYQRIVIFLFSFCLFILRMKGILFKLKQTFKFPLFFEKIDANYFIHIAVAF